MQKNDIVKLEITDIGVGGEGIGKVDGYTLFVKDAIIEDVIEAKVMKAKKNYGYAKLLDILTPSEGREKHPGCAIARKCGGCQIQEMKYDWQLRFKEEKVRGALTRLGEVPEELLDMASVYLEIIFLGAPFTYFYNAVSAALKSVGDSKTPLRFLAFSAILNALLDLIFIGVLGFGIVCSATTTVIAEAASALLCIGYVYRKIPMLRLGKGEFHMDGALLKRTLQYGTVTALQQSCQPIGKLLIQGAINPLGVDMIAAYNAVNRVDDYAFTPEQSISHGITTFVAQNRGAGKKERIGKGFATGLALEAAYWVLICSLILLLRKPIMGLFVTDGGEGVVQLGASYLGMMAFFYIFPAFTNGFQGFFRGMGRMKMTLLGTFIQTSLRVIFVYLLVPVMGMNGAAVACVIGWSVMLLVEVPYGLKILAGEKRKGM